MRYVALALQYRVGIILGLTLLISALVVPGFLGLTTLNLGLDRASTIGIIAIGLTVLLIAGQIDLSVGSVFAGTWAAGSLPTQLDHSMALVRLAVRFSQTRRYAFVVSPQSATTLAWVRSAAPADAS